MILETLDVKKNDIFVYSLNQFSLSANFKLLNKDAKVKYPKSIHYNDVCRYINDGRPKNLILYRLLTNLTNLDPNYLKYGITMVVDGYREVLYFDPIFAVKELEELSEIDMYPNLRFRVQQVGLISLLRSFGEPHFHEAYSFDLEAAEVKHQNDRVFAEIIFAFDEVHFDEEDVNLPAQPERQIPQRRFVAMTAEEAKSALIEEDPSENVSTMRRLSAVQTQTAESLARGMQQELRRRTLETSKPPSKPVSKPEPSASKPEPPAVKAEPPAVKAEPPAVKAEPPKSHFEIINTGLPQQQSKPSQPPAQKSSTAPKPAGPSGEDRSSPLPTKTPKPADETHSHKHPGPARAVPSKTDARQMSSEQPKEGKTKVTFSDFLGKVKKNMQEAEQKDKPEERQQVINLFKTSAHIQNFVVERSTKQVVLKLKKQ